MEVVGSEVEAEANAVRICADDESKIDPVERASPVAVELNVNLTA